jgi:hypothetical protein
MGYKAAYPEEAIRGHRAFITRRRATRPSEEYRSPSDSEWEEFLGHFERRRVVLGDCGRAYSTSCIHEHSCLTEMILRWAGGQSGILSVTLSHQGIFVGCGSRACWLMNAAV